MQSFSSFLLFILYYNKSIEIVKNLNIQLEMYFYYFLNLQFNKEVIFQQNENVKNYRKKVYKDENKIKLNFQW